MNFLNNIESLREEVFLLQIGFSFISINILLNLHREIKKYVLRIIISTRTQNNSTIVIRYKTYFTESH